MHLLPIWQTAAAVLSAFCGSYIFLRVLQRVLIAVDLAALPQLVPTLRLTLVALQHGEVAH